MKICVPDAGPIKMLAAANLLRLLLAPPHHELVLVDVVVDDLKAQSVTTFTTFLEQYAMRIQIAETSQGLFLRELGQNNSPNLARAQRNASERAVADFLMDLTEVRAPTLVIYEDEALGAQESGPGVFSECVRFITTAAYLRRLEAQGYIRSFDEVWARIVKPS